MNRKIEQVNTEMRKIEEEQQFSWLSERTILISTTGSRAYGTSTVNSDTDYKGICVPPIEYYLGLESYEGYDKSTGKNFKNTKDDIDFSIIHLTKFVKDAMQGVPNNIEVLFSRKEDYLKITELGQMLIDNRHLFLSKAIKDKYGGYSRSQIQKIINTSKGKGGRTDLIEAYGYDTKMFAHTVRLIDSAIEILSTGDFSTYRHNREFLLECRHGFFSLEKAIELLERLDKEFIRSYENSKLPLAPDYERINQLLIEMNERAINGVI